MNTKEIKINCPEGFEIDKENSTFECIKFKPINKKLPKTWEEYCRTHKRQYKESWIDDVSNIVSIDITQSNYYKDVVRDKKILPSRKYAEAMLALCQLIQLMDCYNDGWEPEWNKGETKYCIEVQSDNIVQSNYIIIKRILAFKTEELRRQFFRNFKDLIEIAKPLL